MEKIKNASIAGLFYPADKEELKKTIETFSTNETVMPKEGFSTRAIIVPHAGYIYSGKIAYNAIRLLDKNIKTIFIFAPCHKVAFDGLCLTELEGFQTPLGTVEVNRELVEEVKEKFNINYNEKAFEDEHSMEVQLPLIQTFFENIKIVPILVGKEMPEIIEKIIAEYYQNKEYGFIVSSDLSHYLDEQNCDRLDGVTAHMIETGETFNFRYSQACGCIGIVALTNFASDNDFSMIRMDMGKSSAVTKDSSRVVGYGSWVLYEGERNQFIKDNFEDFILNLCKTSLESSFHKNPVEISYPRVLEEIGSCFVTLEKEGKLRGCIGTVAPKQILVKDIVLNTKNAAFSDPRFEPVKEEEVKDIKFAVSILGEAKAIVFDNEEDLLNQIVPNEDGLIIEEHNAHAVFLPSVWEQVPDKKEFLNSLKIKAGFDASYFSNTIRAYKFSAAYIKQS